MARLTARVASVAVSLLLLGAGSALAFNPQPDPPAFGMFGITEFQRAHLHVALPAVQANRGEVSPGPCHVQAGFVNEDGVAVVTEIHTLMPGQAGNTIFSPARITPEIGGLAADIGPVRHQLRAVVTPLDRAFPPGPCRDLLATVQVDNQQGGAPTLTLGPRDQSSNDGNSRASVTHLFGPLAIGFGHTARFNAVNTADGSVCQLSWAFVDETGARIDGVALVRGGTAVHVDFAHTDATRGVALIRAEATTSGKGCPSSATIGTLEGFDSALGTSHSIVPAQLIVPAVQ